MSSASSVSPPRRWSWEKATQRIHRIAISQWSARCRPWAPWYDWRWWRERDRRTHAEYTGKSRGRWIIIISEDIMGDWAQSNSICGSLGFLKTANCPFLKRRVSGRFCTNLMTHLSLHCFRGSGYSESSRGCYGDFLDLVLGLSYSQSQCLVFAHICKSKAYTSVKFLISPPKYWT